MALPQLDQFSFHQDLAQQPGAVLVIFTAPACGACRHWKAFLDTWRLSPGALPVYEVDVSRDQALAREYEVELLPALMLFVAGEYHRPLQSVARTEALNAAIAAALRAPALEAP